MAAIDVEFNASPRIITILSPDVSADIQTLYDLIRAEESRQENLQFDPLVSAGGKESLGGSLTVGITMTLQNAKLAFEARPGPAFVQCSVNGGNLVAVDDIGDPISAIETTAFTQVIIAQSTSAALIDGGSISGDLATIASDVAAVKTKTDALPSVVKRGVAITNFPLFLRSSVDHVSPATGLAPSIFIRKDAGAFAASTNGAVEVGFGSYDIDLTGTELDAATVTLFVTAVGADPIQITILTNP